MSLEVKMFLTAALNVKFIACDFAVVLFSFCRKCRLAANVHNLSRHAC